MSTREITEADLTRYNCYGQYKSLVVSWSRLNDWFKCKQRVKLIHDGKRGKLTNARNFLVGNLADHSMRAALEGANKDPEGRLLSLTMDELLKPLPEKWEEEIKPTKNTIMKWNASNPRADQEKVYNSAVETLEKLHPILVDNIVGRRFIPEFRPKEMPIIGIPGPNGEPCYIRLFLAIDCAVQIKEDPTDPNGLGDWGIFDLKTTARQEYLTHTLPQLVFYDIAWHAMTGSRPVEHALWAPLMPNPIISLDVTDEDRLKVTEWIISYCHSVWAGEAELTEDEDNCFNCSTKKSCPKIVQPITKDAKGISRIHFGQKGGMLHG